MASALLRACRSLTKATSRQAGQETILDGGRKLPPGTRDFLLIVGGQVVSTFGTGLTTFALGVWTFRKTGRVTEFALIGLFSALPAILFSPVAGALVDRWDRRRAMMLSDAGAAVMTLLVAALLLTGSLTLPVLYGVMIITSLFTSLSWPAYAAAITLLVPKSQLGRASGIDQLGLAASQLLAPAAAGFLLAVIQVPGLLLIDAATYLVSFGMLVLARVPRLAAPARQDSGPSSLAQEIRAGWHFIAERPGLRDLLLYLAMINLLAGFNAALETPLVLSLASPIQLGAVLSVVSAGLLAGSILMSAHGGPRRRADGVLGFGMLYSASFLAIGLWAAVPAIAAASFALMFCVPLINGCSQAIWQSKVPPELQGRVFAVRRMIAQATLPLALIAAGPLADRIAKPLLAPGGALAASVGRIFGTGGARAIGLLYVALGAAASIASVMAWTARRFRRLEDDLPDCLEE
jgi:DHA3 family macrolide efflux protein-like MFS transporter